MERKVLTKTAEKAKVPFLVGTQKKSNPYLNHTAIETTHSLFSSPPMMEEKNINWQYEPNIPIAINSIGALFFPLVT